VRDLFFRPRANLADEAGAKGRIRRKMMAAVKILALGPNPALQRVLSFDSPLEIGSVNRAASVESYVGGKGQGMALALQRWVPGSSAVAHFLGGDNGRFVEQQLTDAGLEQVVQHVDAPTRICTTLLTGTVTDAPTELIDPSGAVTQAELDGLLTKIREYLVSSKVGGMALCGTTPPGAGALYASMCRALLEGAAADPGLDSVLLLLDGHKNVDDVLGSGRVDGETSLCLCTRSCAFARCHRGPCSPAMLPGRIPANYPRPHPISPCPPDPCPPAPLPACLSACLTVLKINCDEARALTGKATPELAAQALLTGDDAPLRRPNALLALTDGPKPARLFAKGGASWTLAVPKIECVNAIGAGDVCTGVLLHSLASGMAPPDAFAMGLAAACARCQHNLPEFSREEVEAMRKAVQIEAGN
jgi:fructose-1-phosphate kinase PfkB-like protein